ncbi:hypothetical protein D9M72_374920 [compost metagenome]
MYSVSTVAMCESFCGILKAQRRLASVCGSTMEAEAASATIGVSPSATASSAAMAVGVMLGPTITSTFSSEISLRTLRTAAAGSVPSSRIT